MTTTAGQLLLNQIMPLIMAAIARGAVKPVGTEDPAELQAEGIALAAALLDSAEAKGKCVTAGNVAFYAIQGMNLEWVGPNAAFDPAKVGATNEPYRLAWVANVQPSGSIADVVRLITLYVDAGDGTVIGGDVVE